MSFFDIFVGEFVELSTTEYVEGTHVDEESGTPIVFKEPITITGYLVDMDDDYYLLGDKHDEVCDSVRKDSIWRMRMIDPQGLIADTLEKFPTPTNENEIN